MQKYKLKITTIAEGDLRGITEYITNVLKNKIAANNFLNEFDKSVKTRFPSFLSRLIRVTPGDTLKDTVAPSATSFLILNVTLTNCPTCVPLPTE